VPAKIPTFAPQKAHATLARCAVCEKICAAKNFDFSFLKSVKRRRRSQRHRAPPIRKLCSARNAAPSPHGWLLQHIGRGTLASATMRSIVLIASTYAAMPGLIGKLSAAWGRS